MIFRIALVFISLLIVALYFISQKLGVIYSLLVSHYRLRIDFALDNIFTSKKICSF